MFDGVPHLIGTENAYKYIKNRLWNKDFIRYILFTLLSFKIESYIIDEDDINWNDLIKLCLCLGLVPFLCLLSPIIKRQIFIYRSNEDSYKVYIEKKKKVK